jgi:hypothetical protein
VNLEETSVKNDSFFVKVMQSDLYGPISRKALDGFFLTMLFGMWEESLETPILSCFNGVISYIRATGAP